MATKKAITPILGVIAFLMAVFKEDNVDENSWYVIHALPFFKA